ncbi:hypothetical protein [Actinoplanes sp. N902-109]|uniref:hypothetical protein n=1 Tax=Actinoplanes sp. (strain N902-109) TaxID=649831 RepID=UPI0003293D86|nr:hypothetical protein [Actinoplanes sp. N902-109]AGL19498.1 hypothetical protein L083_5988 [Actinoplanes sp. N902-109]
MQAHTSAAVIVRALSADPATVPIPDWPSIRARFDAELAAEPEHEQPDTERDVMLRALGLR